MLEIVNFDVAGCMLGVLRFFRGFTMVELSFHCIAVCKSALEYQRRGVFDAMHVADEMLERIPSGDEKLSPWLEMRVQQALQLAEINRAIAELNSYEASKA